MTAGFFADKPTLERARAYGPGIRRRRVFIEVCRWQARPHSGGSMPDWRGRDFGAGAVGPGR